MAGNIECRLFWLDDKQSVRQQATNDLVWTKLTINLYLLITIMMRNLIAPSLPPLFQEIKTA